MINAPESTVKPTFVNGWSWIHPPVAQPRERTTQGKRFKLKLDLLRPLRQWLDNFEVKDAQIAHHLCYLIPAQCPFERDIKLFGRTLFHIPPLCKLNPLYEEVTMLRFRALCYLADECGEDISAYC